MDSEHTLWVERHCHSNLLSVSVRGQEVPQAAYAQSTHLGLEPCIFKIISKPFAQGLELESSLGQEGSQQGTLVSGTWFPKDVLSQQIFCHAPPSHFYFVI